ncbi:hypothetical protein Q8A73_020509 [Channa argus]|nr:hypothetical protein Q8A73_020509 [Channa argus]
MCTVNIRVTRRRGSGFDLIGHCDWMLDSPPLRHWLLAVSFRICYSPLPAPFSVHAQGKQARNRLETQTSLYAQAGDLPSVLEFKSSAPSGRHHFSTKRPVPNLMQYLTKMNGIAIKRTDNLSCLHVSYAVVCLPKW